MPVRGLLLAIALALSSGAAHAGTLTSATWITGIEGVDFPTPLPTGFFAGGSTATSASLSVAISPTTFTRFVPGTALGGLVLQIQRSVHDSVALSVTPGMVAGGLMPGGLRVVTAAHTAGSMFMAGFNELVDVSLPVGTALTHTGTFSILAVAHTYSVQGFAWTPQTLTFTGLTSNGVALPDVVAMGSFSLGAMGGGTISLVAPTRLHLGGDIVNRTTVSLTTLKLTFVPEPGALLLLGVGTAALALGRRRLS